MAKEAKKSQWALEAFLVFKLKVFPDSLQGSSDNLFPEEKRFLFYLDAFWGRITNELQLVQVFREEIDDIISSDSTPEGIKRSTQKMLVGGSTEEAASLLRTLKDIEGKRKIQKIQDVFDKLKEIVTSEEIARMRLEVNEKLKKLSVDMKIGE